MKCPTCNTTIHLDTSVVVWCTHCKKTWYQDEIELYWKGFNEGRNKKNTMDICNKFEGCEDDHEHDACPSRECSCFIEAK